MMHLDDLLAVSSKGGRSSLAQVAAPQGQTQRHRS